MLHTHTHRLTLTLTHRPQPGQLHCSSPRHKDGHTFYFIFSHLCKQDTTLSSAEEYKHRIEYPCYPAEYVLNLFVHYFLEVLKTEATFFVVEGNKKDHAIVCVCPCVHTRIHSDAHRHTHTHSYIC